MCFELDQVHSAILTSVETRDSSEQKKFSSPAEFKRQNRHLDLHCHIISTIIPEETRWRLLIEFKTMLARLAAEAMITTANLQRTHIIGRHLCNCATVSYADRSTGSSLAASQTPATSSRRKRAQSISKKKLLQLEDVASGLDLDLPPTALQRATRRQQIKMESQHPAFLKYHPSQRPTDTEAEEAISILPKDDKHDFDLSILPFFDQGIPNSRDVLARQESQFSSELTLSETVLDTCLKNGTKQSWVEAKVLMHELERSKTDIDIPVLRNYASRSCEWGDFTEAFRILDVHPSKNLDLYSLLGALRCVELEDVKDSNLLLKDYRSGEKSFVVTVLNQISPEMDLRRALQQDVMAYFDFQPYRFHLENILRCLDRWQHRAEEFKACFQNQFLPEAQRNVDETISTKYDEEVPDLLYATPRSSWKENQSAVSAQGDSSPCVTNQQNTTTHTQIDPAKRVNCITTLESNRPE